MIHPDDAERLGLAHREFARVSNCVGEIEVECEVTDEMMPGVVSLPHGYGHTLPGVQMSVAQDKQPGACANYLTDEESIDVLSATHVANGIPVEVRSA